MKLDRKIDFFIVGAQKAGTSSLYQLLSQHKAIFLPAGKDFFAGESFLTARPLGTQDLVKLVLGHAEPSNPPAGSS